MQETKQLKLTLGTGLLWCFFFVFYFTDTALLAGYISEENVSKRIVKGIPLCF